MTDDTKPTRTAFVAPSLWVFIIINLVFMFTGGEEEYPILFPVSVCIQLLLTWYNTHERSLVAGFEKAERMYQDD